MSATNVAATICAIGAEFFRRIAVECNQTTAPAPQISRFNQTPFYPGMRLACLGANNIWELLVVVEVMEGVHTGWVRYQPERHRMSICPAARETELRQAIDDGKLKIVPPNERIGLDPKRVRIEALHPTC